MKNAAATVFPNIDSTLGYTLLLEKTINSIPALIVIYNIKTGKYIYVNDAIEKILGYKKQKILRSGPTFITTLIHPADLPKVNLQNKAALKTANSKNFSVKNDSLPITFEYRIKHRNGSWRWLHSDTIIFSRDTRHKVEYVLNSSIDITQTKEQAITTEIERTEAEKQKNEYHHFLFRSMSLRNQVSDVLRSDLSLVETMQRSLDLLIELLPAHFARLWLTEEKMLHLCVSSGKHPPDASIKHKIKIGQYAVGLVAAHKKPMIVNNIYNNRNFKIQNQNWSKKNRIIAFAGYPLFARGKLLGVITIFSKSELSDTILSTVSYLADILAQEIARRKIEDQMKQSQERYLSFLSHTTEGIWRIEFDKPISTKLKPDHQIKFFYKYAYLAECNDAMARMYGFKKASEILGSRLDDLLVKNNQSNTDNLYRFIAACYTLTDVESAEIDRFGNTVYFHNNLIGIIENNHLVRVWGTQRDITGQKKVQQELDRLSKQKDEFIAIASHELKTPVTNLKAFTQILEHRFRNSNETDSAEMLRKMDSQINRITNLISDLLDISRIEAGKMQLSIGKFKINNLIDEIAEQMQPALKNHRLILKLAKDIELLGDRDRIGQVLINFISNAVKYSPKVPKVILKTILLKNSVKVCVVDFGVGISNQDLKYVFDRFFRGKDLDKKHFPGLGLGLYISSEIIKKHHGKIGVTSTKGHGSTFFFTLPLKPI